MNTLDIANTIFISPELLQQFRLQTARHHAASAVANGKLYVMGGRTESGIILLLMLMRCMTQSKINGQYLSQCHLKEVELQPLLQ
jgi:Kelch motif